MINIVKMVLLIAINQIIYNSTISTQAINIQDKSDYKSILDDLKNKNYFSMALPEFSFISITNNEKLTNEDLKGNYVLFYFWATWCEPCIKNMDNLKKIHQKYEDKNFIILTISHDDDIKKVRKYIDENLKIPWINCIDKGKFSFSGRTRYLERNFYTNRIPYKILIDSKGNIIALNDDLKNNDFLENLLKELLE